MASAAISVPKSDSICDISIIDTTTKFVVPAEAFVAPVQKGHETMNMPGFAFLVHNVSKSKKILFDLGCRKDWWSLPPAAKNMITAGVTGIEVYKSVNEVLREGGVDDGSIDGVVLSHGHFDHTGDLSLFPESVELFVGPGFKDRMIPAYPARTDSQMSETDFRGRQVTEISFESTSSIAGFPSHDFFGDGSFFLLDVPGHAIGHMSGLVRTTSDTFVLMGGDFCHFGGQMRPTAQVPMPSEIPEDTPLDDRLKRPCPCSLFKPAHRDPKKFQTSPFYLVSEEPYSFYEDPKTAQTNLDKMEKLDADDNILICIAHDGELPSVIDFFPNGTLNAWKQKDWKRKSTWSFVNELPIGGKQARPPIVPGLVKNGNVLSKEEAQRL